MSLAKLQRAVVRAAAAETAAKNATTPANNDVGRAVELEKDVTRKTAEASIAVKDAIRSCKKAATAGKQATVAGESAIKLGEEAGPSGQPAITAGEAARRAGAEASAAGEAASAFDGVVNGTTATESTTADVSAVVTATVGGSTSLIALFAGIGFTADRVAVAFNGGAARVWLLVALAAAVLSIVLGLLSVFFRKLERLGRTLMILALAALAASLFAGIWAASETFSDGGRPTLTKVSVVAAGDAHATLSFTVSATGVRSNGLLRVFASWATPESSTPFYVTTLRPNDLGTVNQEVTVLVDRPTPSQIVRLQVYPDPSAADSSASGQSGQVAPPPIPYGAQCGNQADPKLAAVCAEVMVEAAETPPTPTS